MRNEVFESLEQVHQAERNPELTRHGDGGAMPARYCTACCFSDLTETFRTLAEEWVELLEAAKVKNAPATDI